MLCLSVFHTSVRKQRRASGMEAENPLGRGPELQPSSPGPRPHTWACGSLLGKQVVAGLHPVAWGALKGCPTQTGFSVTFAGSGVGEEKVLWKALLQCGAGSYRSCFFSPILPPTQWLDPGHGVR